MKILELKNIIIKIKKLVEADLKRGSIRDIQEMVKTFYICNLNPTKKTKERKMKQRKNLKIKMIKFQKTLSHKFRKP